MPRTDARREWARGTAIGLAFVLAPMLALCGCNSTGSRPSASPREDRGFFGWHFHAPFDTSEVKTVFVYFKSQAIRRDLQLQLTQAVQQEILMRTPYRLANSPEEADSLLSGTITFANKNLVVEAPTNFPRQLSTSITVMVDWTHNPATDAEKKRGPTLVAETVNFVPEVGETTLSANIHVIQSLAKQVVDMMEQPWFNDDDLE